MSFSKLLLIVASVAVSVSALATPANDTVEARAEAASHTGDGTFYTREYRADVYHLNTFNDILIL